MTTHLSAVFEKRFPGGPTIAGELTLPAEGFSATAVLGPSGSGKTTLLRLLAGLETPDAGTITLGQQVWFEHRRRINVPTHRRRVGMLFQDYALFPAMNVRDNLAFGIRGTRRVERERRLADVVERLDLGPLLDHRPLQLSGGQQQRVALGRALAARPKLLLLDEPLAALDVPLRDRLRSDLRRWLKDQGVPVILVTHDRLDAIALADLAIVIADGSVRQIGPLHDVFAHPADSTVAGIVGVESLLPGELVHSADGIAHVRVGPVAITALSPLTHRQPVVVCIRAEDVLLETTTATHSSARNRLPGQVRHVRAEGPVYRVTLDVGFPLDALITRSARDELQLEPGDSILALVKAHAVHLVPHT